MRSIDVESGAYLPRTALVPIFGQRAEGLSASLHRYSQKGRVRQDSREEPGRGRKYITQDTEDHYTKITGWQQNALTTYNHGAPDTECSACSFWMLIFAVFHFDICQNYRLVYGSGPWQLVPCETQISRLSSASKSITGSLTTAFHIVIKRRNALVPVIAALAVSYAAKFRTSLQKYPTHFPFSK